jgi:hypothetical protein
MLMETKVALALALLSGVALQAQVQAPQGPAQAPAPAAVEAPAQAQPAAAQPAAQPGQTASQPGQAPATKPAAPAAKPSQSAPAARGAQAGQPAPRMLKNPVYVRRFSAGLALSVNGLTMMKANTVNPVTTTPPVDALYTSKDLSPRVGYGATAQLALSERFAITAGFFLKRIGYTLNSDIYTGTDDPTTPTVDERTYTVKNENTRGRLYDIPVLVRYYAKDRHESGPRAFFELGGAMRRLSHISTWTDSSVNYADVVCCVQTPADSHAKTTRGVVAGFGVQVNDPIGIRVVPEVRYTHWFNEPFQASLTGLRTRRDEVEAMISLTF